MENLTVNHKCCRVLRVSYSLHVKDLLYVDFEIEEVICIRYKICFGSYPTPQAIPEAINSGKKKQSDRNIRLCYFLSWPQNIIIAQSNHTFQQLNLQLIVDCHWNGLRSWVGTKTYFVAETNQRSGQKITKSYIPVRLFFFSSPVPILLKWILLKHHQTNKQTIILITINCHYT
jgi:hypothetical protein